MRTKKKGKGYLTRGLRTFATLCKSGSKKFWEGRGTTVSPLLIHNFLLIFLLDAEDLYFIFCTYFIY